jgi:hypothetical protein
MRGHWAEWGLPGQNEGEWVTEGGGGSSRRAQDYSKDQGRHALSDEDERETGVD